MRLYQDDIEVGSLAKTGAIPTAANIPASIGDVPVGTRPFDGLIDDVCIFTRTLTPTEISSLYGGGTGMECGGVTASGNQIPTANAGSDQNVLDADSNGTETIFLDASASSDNDGTIVNYLWEEGSTILANGTSPTVSVSLTTDTHTITLTVTDNEGATSSDTVVISVTIPGSLSFTSGSEFNTDLNGATNVQIVDINNDGLNDIAAFEGGFSNSGVRNFAWYEAPNWTQHDFDSVKPGPFIGHSIFVDIDGDGLKDVVVPEDHHTGTSTNAAVYWYKNPGNGSTGTWPRTTMATYSDLQHIGGIAVADMDNDGKDDIIFRSVRPTPQIHILFQDSPSTWIDRPFLTKTREGLSVSDIDEDGIVDIMQNGFWWAGPNNWRTDGYTEFTIDSAYYSQPIYRVNNSTKQGHADINGDGREDVIISIAEGAAGDFAWYEAPLNRRTGTWVKHTIDANILGYHQVQLGDIDNDGDIDIMTGIVPGLTEGLTGVFVYQNSGVGTFTKNVISATNGAYYGVIGDIGNDGDLDIVAPDNFAGGNPVYLYENLLN